MTTPDRLPTFLVIGAAKCGTTSLAAYLAAHPQVFMARPKEVNFFSMHWHRGAGWYAEKFSSAPPDSARGEASVQYSQYPLIDSVPDRIASLIPHARLVYLVRDPVAQMRSFHRHLVHKGKEPHLSLARAVREQPLYLATASYGAQLARYREHFASDAILVLSSEQLLDGREETFRRVLAHIGVDASITSPNLAEVRNTAEDKLVVPSFLAAPRALWRRSHRITGRIPRSWRHALRKRMGRPLPAADLDPATMEWLRDRLAPDFELLTKLTDGRATEWTRRWLLSPVRV